MGKLLLCRTLYVSFDLDSAAQAIPSLLTELVYSPANPA